MRTADTKLKTTTQRGRLAVRAAPYFTTIAPRRLLGYVKRAGDAGRWLVQVEVGRTASGQPVRRREQLGVADDLAQANGLDVLDYEQARAAAVAWQPVESAGPSAFLVRHAVEQHRNFGGKHGDKTERAKVHAYNILRHNVLREDRDGKPLPGVKGLGDLAVADLTTEQLVAWRAAMVKPESVGKREYEASRATATRVWAVFKSALNQAYRNKANGLTSTQVWDDVDGLGKVGNKREIHFSEAEVLAMIDSARASNDPAFADLCEAGFLTGARYGELCALTVRDFDARLGLLSIPDRSEKNRCKTGARIVTLTDEAISLFTRLAKDRAHGAPLLSPDGVERWDASQQQRRIKAALIATGADAETVFYAFRHSHISRAIENGMPLPLIEKNTGTSHLMIKKYYGKALAYVERELVRRSMPKLRVVASKVEPLKEAA